MDGKRVWKQALIPDWEVDNKLHPPAQPAGEGMMWRYSEKDGRKEWSQEGIGDWYADSANHPPTESRLAVASEKYLFPETLRQGGCRRVSRLLPKDIRTVSF